MFPLELITSVLLGFGIVALILAFVFRARAKREHNLKIVGRVPNMNYSEVPSLDELLLTESSDCLHCADARAEGLYFCPFCRKSLRIPRVCNNCGKQVPPNSNFCISCGQRQQ